MKTGIERLKEEISKLDSQELPEANPALEFRDSDDPDHCEGCGVWCGGFESGLDLAKHLLEKIILEEGI